MDLEIRILIILVHLLLIFTAFHCGTEYGRLQTLVEIKHAGR